MHPIMARLTDLLKKKKTMIRSSETLHANEILQTNHRLSSGYMQPYGFKMIGRERQKCQIIKKFLGSPSSYPRNVSIYTWYGRNGRDW